MKEATRGKKQDQPRNAAEQVRSLDRPERYVDPQNLKPIGKGGYCPGHDKRGADTKSDNRDE